MGLQRLYTLALAAQQPLNCGLFNRSSSSIGCGDCGDCGELDLPVETNLLHLVAARGSVKSKCASLRAMEREREREHHRHRHHRHHHHQPVDALGRAPQRPCRHVCVASGSRKWASVVICKARKLRDRRSFCDVMRKQKKRVHDTVHVISIPNKIGRMTTDQRKEGWQTKDTFDSTRQAKHCWNVKGSYGSVSKPCTLVNIKIAGKWMFIPLKMVLIGIDPYPNQDHCAKRKQKTLMISG